MAVDFVILTSPDGKYLSVQPSQVVAITERRPTGVLTENVNCVLFTVDGKFYSVVETCNEVDRKLKRHGVDFSNPPRHHGEPPGR